MRGIPRRSLLACFCVLLLNQSLFLTSSEASTFEGISALIPREGFVLAAAQAQPVPATAPPSKKDSKKQKVLHVLNTRHVASDLKGQNIITRLLWDLNHKKGLTAADFDAAAAKLALGKLTVFDMMKVQTRIYELAAKDQDSALVRDFFGEATKTEGDKLTGGTKLEQSFLAWRDRVVADALDTTAMKLAVVILPAVNGSRAAFDEHGK